MGSVEPTWTEGFIISAFRANGENPTFVKIMRDKLTGTPAGYCFVHFASEDIARMVMHKLNGKVIPNSSPPTRFKLNYVGNNSKFSGSSSDREHSLFVGDLSQDVDDLALYKCFSARYRSIRTAKVVLDNHGFSKGYAFVRFAAEADQAKCVKEMNGYVGLGSKPIKVSSATPRSKSNSNDSSISSSNTVPTYDYAQAYYASAAWQNYSWQSNYYLPNMMSYDSFYQTPSFEGSDGMELIDHTSSVNVEEMNQAVLGRDMDFWDSIENSKWSPVEAV